MMLQIVLLLVTHFLEYFCTDFALKLLELGPIINLVKYNDQKNKTSQSHIQDQDHKRDQRLFVLYN